MTSRPYIKIHGVLDEALTLTDRNVTLLADPGTSLTSSVTGPIVTVAGASDVRIYDLTIRNALGMNMGWGVIARLANSGTQQPSVTLERVTIRDCAAQGILGDELTTVRMSRCLVAGNLGGGARLLGNFDITNSMFVANGAAASNIGGVSIEPVTVVDYRFCFNTVAGNRSAQNINGMNCATPITTTSNIIADNKAAPNCGADYSLLDIGAGPQAHNRFGNPQFKNTTYAPTLSADYYRINDISPAIDGALATDAVMIDIDGDARPQGAAPDIGADELK